MDSERYKALLVGNSSFPDDDGLRDLIGPRHDTRELCAALTHKRFGLFESRNITVLLDRPKPELAMAMEEFFSKSNRNDQLLLYYSGHGLLNQFNAFYLAARNTRLQSLVSTGIGNDEISAMIRQSPARTFVVLLDCCHSGRWNWKSEAGISDRFQGTGRFVVTSSGPGELSPDAETTDSPSPFTSHLVAALTSPSLHADAGVYVTLDAIYQYVYNRLAMDDAPRPQRSFDETAGSPMLAKRPVRVRHTTAPKRSGSDVPLEGGSIAQRAGRIVIERVRPEIDGGQFPVKRVVGEEVTVEAAIYADGIDELSCLVLHRSGHDSEWRRSPMRPLVDSFWRGAFRVVEEGTHRYTVEAQVDHFHTWVRDLIRRLEAGRDVTVELHIGAEMIAHAAERASASDAEALREAARAIFRRGPAGALSLQLAELMSRYPDRSKATRYQRELEVIVESEHARFSAWYGLYPRSASPVPGRHGTLKDVEARLPYVADLGFDVLYMPPIHPIGASHRMGRDGRHTAEPNDPGSPWAVGGREGGHTAIHPELGTLDDFRRLVRAAKEHGIDIAMEMAFHASPDHPYVREHPEWFRMRPDGTIQGLESAEQADWIYPFDFECEKQGSLWQELRSVVQFWIDQGVRIFLANAPDTKSIAFWEWLIHSVRSRHADVIWLAQEARNPHFTYQLAKRGFSQGYEVLDLDSYQDVRQLIRYFADQYRTEVAEYFRCSLWANDPQSATELLHRNGRPANAISVILAATLAANYGIFGPSFELATGGRLIPGSDRSMKSEKYEIGHWNLDEGSSLQRMITKLNHIRRQKPALQQDRTLRFLKTDNKRLLAYAKTNGDGDDVVVVVVNLDPNQTQTGWIEVPARARAGHPPYVVDDLLNDAQYTWRTDGWNYVELNPTVTPAHILQIPRPLLPEVGEGFPST